MDVPHVADGLRNEYVDIDEVADKNTAFRNEKVYSYLRDRCGKKVRIGTIPFTGAAAIAEETKETMELVRTCFLMLVEDAARQYRDSRKLAWDPAQDRARAKMFLHELEHMAGSNRNYINPKEEE